MTCWPLDVIIGAPFDANIGCCGPLAFITCCGRALRMLVFLTILTPAGVLTWMRLSPGADWSIKLKFKITAGAPLRFTSWVSSQSSTLSFTAKGFLTFSGLSIFGFASGASVDNRTATNLVPLLITSACITVPIFPFNAGCFTRLHNSMVSPFCKMSG